VEEITWSDWLDFNEDEIKKTPQSAGIFMAHAAMKILIIEGTTNLRQSLLDITKKPCTSDAKRFRYFVTDAYDELKTKLLNDYKQKHDGKLPKCM
jgi:hypothetical protein